MCLFEVECMQLTVYPVVSKFAFSPNGSTCATTFGLRRHHSVHGVRRVRRALRDRRDPEFFFASHSRRKRIVVERVGGRGPGGGLCTSRIQLTHSSLKGAWLQPLNLKCDILVSKLAFNLTHSLKGAWFQHYLKFDILVCFQMQLLYRYSPVGEIRPRLMSRDPSVGLCTLNPVG